MQNRNKGLAYLVEQIKMAKEKLLEVQRVIDDIIGSDEMRTERRRRSSEKLSMRERKILDLIRTGKHNAEIASEIGISKRTVETHKYNIRRKLGLTHSELKTFVVTDGDNGQTDSAAWS